MLVSKDNDVLADWHIVVVDSDPTTCAELRQMLVNGSARRLRFSEMSSAQECIEFVFSSRSPPDCILLEYDLKDHSVFQLLAGLRGSDGMPVCPVIVLTTSTTRANGREILHAGAQDYIAKDWTNAFALNRSIENARVSWAMARELRLHEAISRRLSERDTFRSTFLGAISNLADEFALQSKAVTLIGQYLNANCILFCRNPESGALFVGGHFNCIGHEQIVSAHAYHEIAQRTRSSLELGINVVCEDVRKEDSDTLSEKQAYASLNICAHVGISIVENGVLCALLWVHQSTARKWSIDEISTAEEITALTWSAIEHGRSKKRLLAQDFQLTQILQIMPSFSAVLVGPEFVFQMANQSYFDLVGRGAEIIGKTLSEAIPEMADQPFPEILERVYRTGVPFKAQSMALRLKTASNIESIDLFVDFVYLPLLDVNGKVSSIFIHGVDRTKEVQTTKLLAEQDARKDEFLATLAHELRNPLAPIRNCVQLLSNYPSKSVIDSTLPIIERQLGHLILLIDDLLDVSRMTSGKIVLKRQRLTVQEIARVSLETIEPLIASAGHKLLIEWPQTAVWIDADPMRMAQVFSNLLANSAKYMNRGGQILFKISANDYEVTISVSDHGFGIPIEMLGRVFDLFTQVNRTLDRAEGGLGVGLSLVKNLVKLHGGEVHATSEGLNKGSCFTVTLPTSAALAQIPKSKKSSLPNGHLVGQRILVVDDNVDAAKTMAMLLNLAGHTTRVAFNGTQALEMARSFAPKFVFLDIGLPGMNGYEVAQNLLNDPLTAKAKLIALTGWAKQSDVAKAKSVGFVAHLTKPVEASEIDAVMAKLAADE